MSGVSVMNGLKGVTMLKHGWSILLVTLLRIGITNQGGAYPLELATRE